MPALKVTFDPYEALVGAHAAVVVTEWEEIRTLDLERASALMEEPKVLVDGRNALDPETVLGAGLAPLQGLRAWLRPGPRPAAPRASRGRW
jgi:UDPglucose 6-dehydrogenase